ncbi:hypothetical protein RIF29_21697 [Crotalaria pallida]|uniref:HTH myb-type domain-containing protein n=1 Tax=Crotalaria pallida TaxID=3830 RepID=A0AAN9F577_CROPI
MTVATVVITARHRQDLFHGRRFYSSESLLLTLYNKSLLGNDMGKFPAPFMMNTIHFALQVVLSKLITWFWSQRFQTNVAMSWAYYFLKGLLRCGKSCRLKWTNYLRPDIKRVNFIREEEDTIIQLHDKLGNRSRVLVLALLGMLRKVLIM